MSSRTEALASRVEATTRQVIASVEPLDERQWNTPCAGEGCSVGTTVHHIGAIHGLALGLLQGLAEGQPLPAFTWDDAHAMNAQHATEFATCDKQETLDLLQQNSERAVEFIRGLDDEQLERSSPWETLAPGESFSVERIIIDDLIDHPVSHLASIRASV